MKRFLAVLVLLTLAAGPAQAAKPGLQRFPSCKRLVAYGMQHRPQYRPGGTPPQFSPTVATAGPTPTDVAAAPAAAPAADSGGGGDFSLTNNQEAGVFEPDIVKTDGSTVYAVTPGGVLEVVDVRTTPKVIGALTLPPGYNHQLLLYRGRLLVANDDLEGRTALTLVDVSDGAKPAVVQRLTVNGGLLAERRTKNTIRVVLSVTPRAIAADAPAAAGGRKAWLPRATIAGKRRTLVGCKQIRRPRAFTGLEELTVLTIDLDKGLDPVDADAVMTGGGTVYASADDLYVVTQRYAPQLEAQTDGTVPDGRTSQVHRFSLDDADTTTYRGSGNVPGFVLNQFSLSEQDGVLRVASTEEPPWFERTIPDSQSFVTTIKADGMTQLGQVGGLGKGERIFAVRMFGDRGYVVTYRQIDPLFTLDLSDPANPAVKGELELPGFSSYLHPISADRLIGVGSGPRGGVQLSEFDVADMSHPRLEQQTEIADGSTEVAYDHHAFLWWEPRSLAVLPISVQAGDPTTCSDCPVAPMPYRAPAASAFAFTVRPEAITEAGRVTHPDNAIVRRSILLGDRLLTISDGGLQASSLEGYADRGYAAFSGGAGTATPPSP